MPLYVSIPVCKNKITLQPKGVPVFVVRLRVSAEGMWEYVQLLNPAGLPNNVTVTGG